MWVGAALALLSVLLVPLQTDTIREQFADQPDTGVDIDTLVNSAIGFAVVVGLISVGLWALMAVMNRKGKKWARITATVLAGVIVYLLWQRSASEWFDAMSRGSATSA
jgi:hypothetical protein